MKKRLLIILFCLLIIFACSNKEVENQDETIDYDVAREIAWNFICEHGWDTTATGNWKEAIVTTVIINSYYELLDESYLGKEALAISFEDKANVISGTPVILIDKNVKKVIGYLPSE